MYAVLVTLELDPVRWEETRGFLQGVAVPMITKGAGFVSGTWLRSADGRRGQSVHLYESRELAEAAARRAAQGPAPGAQGEASHTGGEGTGAPPITFVAAEVLEVVAQA